MKAWYPHVTVATVIERDGKFLLVEEQTSRGLVYNQPAGHLDPDEDLVHAAVRETLEETAWHVRVTGLLGLALYTAPSNGITYHRTTFIAEPLRHDPGLTLDTGVERALWLDYEQIVAAEEHLRSPLVLTAVQQYRAGHRYPLDMIYS